MKRQLAVKKSISMPESFWRFLEKHSREEGHGMLSRSVQSAIALAMKKSARK
jgi:hypothetical protein